MTEPSLPKLTNVIELVDKRPRTVSEMYRDAVGLPAGARVSLAQKTQRRRLADELESLVDLRLVQRKRIGASTFFWR